MLYVDVSGFTKITESANSKGHYGIEIVTEVLNNYFEKLAKLVYAKGGYIAKYGGDSCLSVFPYLQDTKVIEELSRQIDELCVELDAIYHQKYGFGFLVHGGVAFCPFTLNIVGDKNFHADYYIYSKVLSDLYQKIDAAHTNGIMLPMYELAQGMEPIPPESCEPVGLELFLPQAVVAKLQKESHPAELRNAVVVFINIMPVSGDMIPAEDYHEFYCLVQKWVYEFGGVVSKIDYTDKGYLLIGLFGAPNVHADDVERAFLCSLRIIQIANTQVKCRIGITSSNIFCGVIGSSLSYEYGIIGNAVNIAARLMSQAEAGHIALSADILPAIASRFQTRFVQSAKIKGIKEPIQIHILESELPEHWAFFNAKFQDLPILLAAPQLNIMDNFIAAKEPMLMLISGSKGMGKSFLVWQLWNKLQQESKHPEISMVDRRSQSLRLEFFFNLCRRKMGISSFRQEFERITELAKEHQLDWNEAIISRYLFPAAESTSRLKPEEIEIARECLTGLCLNLLSDRDCLLIDNYDLYDAESQIILSQLIIRFLATGKRAALSTSEDDCFALPEGFERCNLKLQALSHEQSVVLINECLPLISAKAKSLLHSISKGNPLFLIGLVQQIKTIYDTSSDLISDNTIIDLQAKGIISTNLENIMMASYEAMDANSKRLLRLAAVYGSSFSLADLQTAFSIDAQFPMQKTLLALLEGLCLELELQGTEPRYNFTNPLLRDSIYRSVLLGDKKEYHRQIATSLATLKDYDDDQLQRIVYHYLQAEVIDQIIHWSKIAAKRFFNAGAWGYSRRYYQILQDWSDNPEDVSEAQLKLVELCLLQADNAEAKVILDALPELSGKQAEYAVYLTTVYLNNTAAYVPLQEYLKARLPKLQDSYLKSLVNVYYLESMIYTNEQRSFFKTALSAYAAMEGIPDLQNRLAGVIAQAYINQGDYALAYQYYSQKRELATKLADGLGLRIALNGMGVACFRMGKKAEAKELYQEALRVAEQTGDRNGYSKVMLNLGIFLKGEMRYDEALECYNKALLLAKKMGNLMQESILIYDIGEMLYHQGKLEEALPLFLQSLEIATRIRDYSGISFCNDAIGDSYYRLGEYAKAEETYRTNLKLQKQINDREGIAHTWGNLGNCAKTKKDYPQARKYYYKQIKLLSKVQDWDGTGRARFNLAMANREQKLYKRALHQLLLAKELFTRCQAGMYLQQCEEQLAILGTLINPR